MSTTSVLPSYTEVATALTNTTLDFEPAQLHGLLCGFLCGTPDKNNIPWPALFGQTEPPSIVQALYETSYHQITEFSFEFALLLPDDSADINQRAEALGLWTQGFLTGLQQQKINIQGYDGEIGETLNDLLEVSQITYGDIPADEEDETAYFEVVEYVRLAVLMLFNELHIDKVD